MLQYGREEFLSRLFLSIMNREENAELLAGTPYESKGVFALAPRVMVGEKDGDFFVSQGLLTNEMVNELEIDIESLIDAAKENTKRIRPGRVVDGAEFMSGMDERDIMGMGLFDGIMVPKFYVMTNSSRLFGAAAMFYQPELLDNLSSMFEKDVVVFPVSEEGVFCVPYKSTQDFRDLQEGYMEACAALKEDGRWDVLSDQALHYDRNRRTLSPSEGESFPLEKEAAQYNPVRHRGR